MFTFRELFQDRFFNAGDSGGPPPAAPPAPATPPPAADPGGENEANKFRRLHEKAEADRKAAEARAEAAEGKLKAKADAELSELDLAKQQAADAKAESDRARADADALKAERLREKIAAKHGLSGAALDLLTGVDEAALEVSAAKIASVMKLPVQAGTHTQPPAAPTPTYGERIAAATKNGNTLESIRLLREQSFAPKDN